jgi:flavin reductase (DIM6/NTAB) family NADH-FMN oxidoreductase RutF
MVDEALAQAMVDTAATLPHGQSELEGLGLTITPSEKITVPRITEAPIAMECTEHSVIEIGRNRLILGIVHMIHARDGFFDNNHHLMTGIYHPIGRMASPDWYTRTGDQLEIPRPD